MAIKLTKVDPLVIGDHYYLTDDDDCYFIGEYTPRAGYTFSSTNDLIQNLKKPMNRKGTPEWRYKTWAIKESARLLKEAVPKKWLEQATIVPVPPSKTTDDPEYDDRLKKILSSIDEDLDVREIVTQTESITAAHECDERPKPDDLARLYAVDQDLIEPTPDLVVIFDDVLTAGCHFKAMQNTIRQSLPDVPVIGIFLARRVVRQEG